MFWGLSPALDLQEEYFSERSNNIDELNILIIGGSDARHILKTIAQSYRQTQKRNINFHVIEGCPELVARQMLLLCVAFEDPERLGLLDKTRLFMEIYGNTLLRYTSSKYMISASRHLIKMITDLNYMERTVPMIFCDKIKYRERDYIEILMKFWASGYSNKFDICDYWDKRLRNSLGVRYDSRVGVFDWDYNMRLRDVGGSSVNALEYKHFRSTGVAFTWLETEVCRPNYTLAAGVITSGENFIHRGYLGDIVTGPYIGYGLDCEDEEMMKSSHGTFHKRATDISERNIMRMFHELHTGNSFKQSLINGDTDHNLGMVTLATAQAKLSEQTDENNHDNKLLTHFINNDYATIHFHSFSNLEIYPSKTDYQNKFHIMFVGNNLVKKIQPSISKLLAKDGLVILEGQKFILDMKKDTIKEFGSTVTKIAQDCDWRSIGNFDPMKDSFAKFVLN